ncbi:hypothetical protein V8G54_013525 [Vigna mungo]|uniref:Uncharacterized protein n=1 Tax=Vigna mungo TaxID=3915 RepID=A0AAQ3NTV5_VIGMU
MLRVESSQLSGNLPVSFEKLSSLRYLSLFQNQLSGNPFGSLRSLSKLSFLDIGYNRFEGVVMENHLINLKLQGGICRGSDCNRGIFPLQLLKFPSGADLMGISEVVGRIDRDFFQNRDIFPPITSEIPQEAVGIAVGGDSER